MYKITEKKNLGNQIIQIDVHAPSIASKALAGQFIIVRQDEFAERIPLTIADYNREKGTITLVFQAVGFSTQALMTLSEGNTILDVVGPLGMPTEIEQYGTVVCIGGGVGIAPVYPIAKALKAAGNRVIAIIGARNEELLFLEKEMASVSDVCYIATDDGSVGVKGFVTDLLQEVIQKESIDHLWAIGPMVMMKAVSETTRPFNIKTTVSLNPIMVDGTGMCGGCRVQIGTDTKFACVDGPEFDGHLVDFDLAMRRAAVYKEDEKKAVEQHECKCGGAGLCQH
ncbi:sulfide/dihydroorotate dehydrogenase-like FAD/NAD-binding protein [Fusibacter paucivorans]|uniref:Sulfide/dihydroorotate dehydrogenase-like FAD/NAD-binding protein n=1 Tax=Fusibacter paucivorans TaxID=76009 RepID=A0ABS5PLZ1_9FIRM|nr:sulfide/dihydroorotate dehydrogenase-like FAD/NAD-binding protein [Fusibacter paucivorans]MBS7526200.1 sulfide/dihydroorotate dehydrogenase-like FAD/NAD-binding protein [Fusibacter paucivorans]